ncbi:uncharacterized protein [Choristoneura fumiferana]|uniref:uncharacterized protein n=1 Tax=Choristoneura fumiferana TaxID=7141 RepID=UPI003D158DF4
MYIIIFLCFLTTTRAGPATESVKDQHCTDPRTMRKHAAYTEWADAYSCTRHRCQPGGRNLAIYTVGCKRVEAPESAIECEEVVEDTNMQFPYCCTRLRCLVVVRGEVWTRVLGQPWETLPAAPWSHMYKMKKPPPVDGTFLPKEDVAGPIYELAEPEAAHAQNEKSLRAKKDPKDCPDAVPRSVLQTPDIVIALSTGNEGKKDKNDNLSGGKHNRARKETSKDKYEDDVNEQHNEIEAEEAPVITEKIPEVASDERFYANSYPATKSPRSQHKESQVSWTEIPQDQWNEHEKTSEPDNVPKNDAPVFHQADPISEEKKEDKPSNFQALVDAIGTRMRDIETVVQKMSEKVRPGKEDNSVEKKSTGERKDRAQDSDSIKPKSPSPDSDQYKRETTTYHPPHAIIIAYGGQSRFHNRGSKYLHPVDSTTEPPVFIEDTNLNGYFSDASNNVVRRAGGPKEPAATYMAPVNTDARRNSNPRVPMDLDDTDPKHKKHTHKKKKSKRGHKKHHKDEKKRFNKISSIEIDRNVVSLEDSGVNK